MKVIDVYLDTRVPFSLGWVRPFASLDVSSSLRKSLAGVVLSLLGMSSFVGLKYTQGPRGHVVRVRRVVWEAVGGGHRQRDVPGIVGLRVGWSRGPHIVWVVHIAYIHLLDVAMLLVVSLERASKHYFIQ